MSDDLLGDELLDERGHASSEDDRRGVAEVTCAMVEYADAICLTEAPEPAELALVEALARPGVPIVTEPSLLDAGRLVEGGHDHGAAEGWVAEVRRGELPRLAGRGVWRLDLCSDRPFHPERFRVELEVLGSGPRRSRGCFWLPTRPQHVCIWDAAGGQASVGTTDTWGAHPPLTRITVVGLDENRDEIVAAFRRCLLTDEELSTRGSIWEAIHDGFEPWLGPIQRVA